MDRVSGKTSKQNERFKTILGDYQHSPEMQEKMKIAFAEGYTANEKRETEQASPWPKRVARLVLYGVIFWLLLQVLQGYSAIGGSKFSHKDLVSFNVFKKSPCVFPREFVFLMFLKNLPVFFHREFVFLMFLKNLVFSPGSFFFYVFDKSPCVFHKEFFSKNVFEKISPFFSG